MLGKKSKKKFKKKTYEQKLTAQTKKNGGKNIKNWREKARKKIKNSGEKTWRKTQEIKSKKVG